MANVISSLSSNHQSSSSPWSLSSSRALSSKAGPPPLNLKSTERFSSEPQSQHSIYTGSTPLAMSGSQYSGRASFSVESNRSLAWDNGRGEKGHTGASHVSCNSNPINAPYGIIGSNLSMPVHQSMRVENQPGISINHQSLSTNTPIMRAAVPTRENSLQLPAAPLSAPPFQTSFFPLFGPAGTRQGFIMPGDWTINPNGFLISESARRLSAMALEVDKAELHRRVSSERKGGPAMGCRMCAVVPRVMLFPCEHSVCSECGSRFMTASGGMYCSCGELVSSMINLNIPRWDLRSNYYMPVPQHQIRPPPGLPAPALVTNDTNQASASFPAVSRQPPVARPATPQHHPTLPYPPPLVKSELGNSSLIMDAETAIENAPFVELGRHALAQNWCCVKISNIPYSVTGENIMEFLGKNAKVVPDDVGLSVHIIMDRASGKTMDAFVEFTCPKDAYRCVTRKRGKILGSRHVLLDVVNQEELMKELFPKAKGITWEGVIPNVSNSENVNKKADLVTKEELVLIVGHARTPHRSPFSRKCLQRPYESILSIVAKFPWFAVSVYTIHQRDIIFQALVSVIDILKRQCKRGRTTPNLDTELLKKLCNAGVLCTGFTNKQKREIVKTGEFGAEGLQKGLEDDIPGFEGLLALSGKQGADRKFIELYGTLGTIAKRHHSDPTASSNGVKSADPEKQAAISRLPSALIDELDEPGHPKKCSSATISLSSSGSLTEMELEVQSKYTMAQMAELEWAAIEKYVSAVLPTRGRSREALARKPSNANT